MIMAMRKIQYQAGDGKWYDLVIWDIIAPLNRESQLTAENERLKRLLKEYQEQDGCAQPPTKGGE